MLNLLLREDRHWLRKEYFLRLGIMLLLVLTTMAIIFSVILFSSYSQVFIEKRSVENQVKDIENSDLTKERNDLKNLNIEVERKMEYLSEPTIDTSVLIAEVLDIEPDGISLNEIGIKILETEKDVIVANIDIRGDSDSRNTLVNFQKALLNKLLFAKVDIPFSNFTKDINVPFSMTITTVDIREYMEMNKM